MAFNTKLKTERTNSGLAFLRLACIGAARKMFPTQVSHEGGVS